ncbi:hypothetical protein [Rhodococcus sp. NPDC058521]|uniref:hypothetical protein n=1 Tax=Rhodococcus sp. NPDC058521 TaxID=3346536 RepID=UPI00365408B3
MAHARKTIIVAATAVAVGVAPAATADASPPPVPPLPVPPHPAATTAPSFGLPAIGDLEIGPGGVPGGSFQPITVAANLAPSTRQYPPVPAAVTFSVHDPASNVAAPQYHQYAYRHLLVSWRNLATGASGEVALRHWDRPDYEFDSPNENLPTSATAATGSGPVVATVTEMRTQYQAPPAAINAIPGVMAIAVP